ncbi:NAD(P)-binding protein [Trichodelitschia bisporula]|uniref:NAD(P)-binding protein n=1 Tax=Trichodelitschia bisporula TaxID=703511 RepID=A0A6G1HKF9_9PEZI|nr:NAD(P)-binding protein [Trichodelitschia bisporula]
MTRILLTGGSGFIAAHVLEELLKHGHSVVTTVRNPNKAERIREAHPDVPKERLDFAIVPDIAIGGAFDQAVVSDPPFEAVIHTASPFHFKVTDVKAQLLDPAIIGTTGLLQSVRKNAPSVKRVVITSSFAAILNGPKGNWPEKTYSEEDWNPITLEEALQNPSNGYRASKTFAEKAAWNFIERAKPNFDLVVINPPLVLGPIVHYLNSLDALNTSNERVRNCIQGQWKDEIPDTGVFAWVDVRDLADIHVKAVELPEAGGKRFFATAGFYSNKEIADIVRNHFPEYKNLPGPDIKGGDYPTEGLYKVDNSRVKSVLGTKFTSLEDSIVDLVKSLQTVGA